MRVVFFGTPQFAAECLEYLLNHQVDVVAVITKPDKPQGRSLALVPTPVKCIALAHTPPLPLFQPEIVSDLTFAPVLQQFEANLFVVVAYGEILKQHLLDMPKVACINLHASLLPKYRGAAPIQRCLINGEKETGVTIMHMAKKMDAGDIITMERVAIPPNMNYAELEAALCKTGKELLLKTIRDFETATPSRTPQDHEAATLAPKIEVTDCKIDWQQPAHVIHNLIRGVTPHPGAWCYASIKGEQKRLKITATQIAEENSHNEPGTLLNTSKQGIIIGCKKGSLLITHLQLEGKKATSAVEFIRGFPQLTLH